MWARTMIVTLPRVYPENHRFSINPSIHTDRARRRASSTCEVPELGNCNLNRSTVRWRVAPTVELVGSKRCESVEPSDVEDEFMVLLGASVVCSLPRIKVLEELRVTRVEGEYESEMDEVTDGGVWVNLVFKVAERGEMPRLEASALAAEIVRAISLFMTSDLAAPADDVAKGRIRERWFREESLVRSGEIWSGEVRNEVRDKILRSSGWSDVSEWRARGDMFRQIERSSVGCSGGKPVREKTRTERMGVVVFFFVVRWVKPSGGLDLVRGDSSFFSFIKDWEWRCGSFRRNRRDDR